MTDNSGSRHPIVSRIREQWAHLTEEDVHTGMRHREHFLERLRHRHNLGLDEAEAQLREFEQKNPGFFFEKS
jgi:hypothetical protein